MATYEVRFSATAARMVLDISDRRIRQQLVDKSQELANEPEKQGAPLIGEFVGYRTCRAAAQRYRIIYRIDQDDRIVLIVAVGIRREGDRGDIYRLARRLLNQGLLN
jgi:mRNA interferase RelE/StbE